MLTYIENNNNGYMSFNRKKYTMFFEKNSHDILFKYVDTDISDIEDLFKKHIDSRMDIDTFELKGAKTNDFLEKIKDRLIQAHPYYEYECQKIIICEIGTYFNRLLVYSLYKKGTPALNSDISKEWYLEKIRALMPCPSIVENRQKENNMGFSNWTDGHYPEGLYPSDFYYYFIKWTKISKEAADFLDNILINNMQKELPVGFKNELNFHKSICNMLHFVLDASVPNLNNLNPHKRLYLYSSIYETELTIKKHFSPHSRVSLQPPTNKDNNEYIEKQDISANAQTVKEYKIFAQLRQLNTLNIAHIGDIPQYTLKALNQAIEYASSINVPKTYEEYEIENLYQLLYLEILSMVQAETLVKKCKNCGKFFIPNKKISVYCDALDEAGKSCQVIGNKRSWKRKLETNEPLREYNKAYKTHYARYSKNKMSKDELDCWRKEAKCKLDKVYKGSLDIIHFKEWLKK